MNRIAVFLAVLLLAFGAPALAQIAPEPASEPDEGIAGVNIGPMRAGRLEIVPILSMRISGSGVVYRVGMSVGYSLTRSHQVGGMFVMGNRLWERGTRLDPVVEQPIRTTTDDYLSIDDGFGSSLTGFYRFNIPFEVEKRTYPYVEIFGGRDFMAWGDTSELGGGIGVRKFISSRTALTTMYAYSVLFANGQHQKRHTVSAGVSMSFR